MDDVLRECIRTWHRLGVPRPSAREMADELRADLATAAADGVAATDFVGGDPAGLAREWASARGLVRGRRRLIRIGVASLVGALPGASMGLFVAYGLSSEAFGRLFHNSRATFEYGAGEYGQANAYIDLPSWLILALYVVSGSLSYLGVVAAVSAALRRVDDPDRAATLRRLRWAAPIGILTGVGAAILYGSTTGFNTDWPHPGLEATLAAAGLVLSAAACRLRPIHRPGSQHA